MCFSAGLEMRVLVKADTKLMIHKDSLNLTEKWASPHPHLSDERVLHFLSTWVAAYVKWEFTKAWDRGSSCRLSHHQIYVYDGVLQKSSSRVWYQHGTRVLMSGVGVRIHVTLFLLQCGCQRWWPKAYKWWPQYNAKMANMESASELIHCDLCSVFETKQFL